MNVYYQSSEPFDTRPQKPHELIRIIIGISLKICSEKKNSRDAVSRYMVIHFHTRLPDLHVAR